MVMATAMTPRKDNTHLQRTNEVHYESNNNFHADIVNNIKTQDILGLLPIELSPSSVRRWPNIETQIEMNNKSNNEI